MNRESKIVIENEELSYKEVCRNCGSANIIDPYSGAKYPLIETTAYSLLKTLIEGWLTCNSCKHTWYRGLTNENSK